jgi:hypothetical protein
MTEFRIKTLRCEWQVVIQQVNDDWSLRRDGTAILARWPTAEKAYADLPNHANESIYVKGRWIPKNAKHAYEVVEVQYREVEIK